MRPTMMNVGWNDVKKKKGSDEDREFWMGGQYTYIQQVKHKEQYYSDEDSASDGKKFLDRQAKELDRYYNLDLGIKLLNNNDE